MPLVGLRLEIVGPGTPSIDDVPKDVRDDLLRMGIALSERPKGSDLAVASGAVDDIIVVRRIVLDCKDAASTLVAGKIDLSPHS